MSNERLEEFKKQIEFLDDSADMDDFGRFVDTLQNMYEDGEFHWIVRYLKEQAERVQELVKAHELKDLEHQGLVRQIKEKDEQNKLYRDLLTSRIVKQLIRLEDKGCFLPEEDREDFLKLKYAVEALEGEE